VLPSEHAPCQAVLLVHLANQVSSSACEYLPVPTKMAPVSESHPDLVPRWMGNVDEDDRRTPDQFSIKARLKCWWWCGDDAHEWVSSAPLDQTYGFLACPQCHQEDIEAHEQLMDQPVAAVPDLVAAWNDPRPFKGLRVGDLTGGVSGRNLGRSYSLRCPSGHRLDTVVRRFVTVGCPWCRGNETRKVSSEKTIAADDPELAATWHPSSNGDRTPENTPPGYRKPLWWKSVQCCGYEWQETVAERVLGRRPQAGRCHYYCPACESVWGSLAWLDPDLAAEWHPDNALTAWHVKPYSGGVVVRWRCGVNSEHEWEASVVDRSAGRLCPHCSTAGTSQIEKIFVAAAQAHDPEAGPARIGRWKVDLLVPSVGLVIEYDGVYWHTAKHAVDLRKSLELIRSGYRVARIRENDLQHLEAEDPQLRQVTFWPRTGRVDDVVGELIEWAYGGA
jgi:hypothetical protein